MSDINFIKHKKNTIRYSSIVSGTANLDLVHTTKEEFSWRPLDGGVQWIVLNVYERELLDRIVIDWIGTLSSLKIERSIDGFNWDILSDTFVPTKYHLDIDYTMDRNTEFIFLRLTVTNPNQFEIESLEVWGKYSMENKDFISHNYLRWYDENFIEKHPLYPDLIKEYLRMKENNNEIDLRIFDDTLFSDINITTSGTLSVGNKISFSINIPAISNVEYVWDFGDGITEWVSGRAYSIGDIIVERETIERYNVYRCTTAGTSGTTEPLWPTSGTINDNTVTWTFVRVYNNFSVVSDLLAEQSHVYEKSGRYYPRLFLKHDKYLLDFIKPITIS